MRSSEMPHRYSEMAEMVVIEQEGSEMVVNEFCFILVLTKSPGKGTSVVRE